MSTVAQHVQGRNGVPAPTLEHRGSSRRLNGRLGASPGHQPLALGLRLAAGLEGLVALQEDDTVRLASGASLLAAAVRPHLRTGALVTATAGHSLRTAALAFEPERRRRKERLAMEFAKSAALAGLLRQAVRAARWEG